LQQRRVKLLKFIKTKTNTVKNKLQNIAIRRLPTLTSWHRVQDGRWVSYTPRTRTQYPTHRSLDPFHPQRGAITQPTLTITFGLMMLISVAMLGFLYLNQVLGTASQGDSVQVLNEKMNDLREKQQRLELEGAQLRSMQFIEQRVQELNLVTTQHVTYLTSTGKQLAAASDVQ
jgi:hypothetical protein